jgi:hypothetical protein
MLLTSRWPRSVRDRREERSDVELERHRRASGRPNESLIDDRRTLIVGMPDFERLGVAVDDAIVRHSIPPKRAALGDPIVAGGSGDRFSQIKMGSSFPKAEVGARRPSVEQRIDPARIALPMLINEYARSGGDELPWLFRYFKIGPLIGKRTWGGLVGIGGYPTLMDGGAVTAPRVGIWLCGREQGRCAGCGCRARSGCVEDWPRLTARAGGGDRDAGAVKADGG